MKRYKPVLEIYFLWHPAFTSGQALSEALYQRFSSNVNRTSERGLGIPVLFRSLPANDDSNPFPLPVKPSLAKHVVVVPLVDNEAVLDQQWGKYLVEVQESLDLDQGPDRLLPVFLSPYAHKLPKPLRPLQSFNLADLPESDWAERLSGQLAHELCRLLLNQDRVAATAGNTMLSKAPVKLFISHAKADGEALAKAFRDYLASYTVMDSFFDAQDIAPGAGFRDELYGQVERSALLIIRSDAYSGRPWCRREVIHAKRAGCALLLADAVEHGESRNFPYCANMRTLRIKDTSDASMRTIINATIFEVLRQLYSRSLLEYLREQFEIVEHCQLLPQPPELMSLLDLPLEFVESGGTVLYPDPPLGCEELELLEAASPNLSFYTPTQLALAVNQGKKQAPLEGQRIGISISNNAELDRLGFSTSHLQNALLEFARYLLSAGAALAYGGDLRDDGLTWNLIELVESYTRDGDVSWQRIQNYLAWPLYKNLTSEEKAKFLDAADFIEVPPETGSPIPEDSQFDKQDIEHRLAFGLSLSHMRRTMTENIDARVVLGGKLQGYSGPYPGIVEEARLAIKNGIPLYVIGGFGGAAKAVAQALEGKPPESLSLAFQQQDEQYAQLVGHYEQHFAPGSEHAIDYPTLCEDLALCGVAGLNNGLNEEDNRRLMTTIYIHEMIALVLKGLGEKFALS